MAQVGPVECGSGWTSIVWLRLDQYSMAQVVPLECGSG